MTAVGLCATRGCLALNFVDNVSTTDEIARTPDSHPSFSLRGFASGYDQTWSSDEKHSSPEELAIFHH